MIWKKDYDIFFIGGFCGLAAQAIVNIWTPYLSLSAVEPMDVVFYLMMAIAFLVHVKGSGSQGGAQ